MPGMWWEAEKYAEYMGEGAWDAPLPGEEPVRELAPVPVEDVPDEELPF